MYTVYWIGIMDIPKVRDIIKLSLMLKNKNNSKTTHGYNTSKFTEKYPK